MEPEKANDATLDRKPRRSKPKVKTGCLTCKNRHVKCDETRPSCIRCHKAGRQCDGYIVALRGPPRTIAPRRDVAPRVAPVQLQRVVVPAVSQGPSMALFDDEVEARYFQLYCTRTATKLGGYWDSGIWTRLVLQACHQEPFARHAIVSIGALDVAMDYQPSLGYGNKAADNAHHQFALREYSKALRLMNTSLVTEDEEHRIRKALISCLIIICFETYQGDPDLALLQAKTAVKIMSSWLKKTRMNRRYAGLGGMSLGSAVVEDDLINALARIYKGVMVFRAPRPNEITQLLIIDAAQRLESMPLMFSSLIEARTYWELHLRFALPWNQQPGFDSLQASAFPKLHPDVILGQDPATIPSLLDNNSLARLEQERLDNLTVEHNWSAAFANVWAYCQTAAGLEDFPGAAILRMQSLCGLISFTTAAVNDEMIYDCFSAEFREIVWLARKLLERSELARVGTANLFSFSIGVVTSIYFVINKCRDRWARRQALELCERHPRRDGGWDSAMVAAVGRWTMEKEESGLSCEQPIPESNRIRLMEVRMPTSKRVAFLRFSMMQANDPIQRYIPPEESVSW